LKSLRVKCENERNRKRERQIFVSLKTNASFANNKVHGEHILPLNCNGNEVIVKMDLVLQAITKYEMN
jgi:hypothetical protein